MKENKMGYVPIPKLITTMSLPIIFSMLVQALYNVIDSIFVAKISENALTALTLANPMQMIVVSVFVGLSIGIGSAISRKLGAKDNDGALQVAEHGVLIGALIYILVAVFGIFGSGLASAGMTQSQEIIDYTTTYIRIIMLFSFGSILAQSGMSIFQGTGDTIKPMVSQLIGAILNIILDPILIFGYLGFPAMGVKGAAIATVFAQIVSMVYIWVQLLRGKSILKIKIKKLIYDSKIVKEIFSVGLPSFMMQALGSVMLFFMNMILSTFGDTAIAVMGVYFRMQSLVFMPIIGLSTGTMPVVGYNFGARDKKRMTHAVKFSTTIAVSFMLICLVLFQIFPRQLLMLFNASDNLMAIGIPAFRTISFIFPIVGINVIFSTTFQGLGKAHLSLIISLCRMILILVPSAYLLSRLGNVDYVWWSFVISDFAAMFLTIFFFRQSVMKNTKDWPNEPIPADV